MISPVQVCFLLIITPLYISLKGWAKAALGAVVGFTVAVRSLIWLLMNWK
jgi:hypothetical protein